MRWTLWILLFAATALVLVLSATVLHERQSTPAEVFADIQERIARGNAGTDEILARLQDALELARSEGDPLVATRIQRAKGRVLLDLGAYDEARADLQAVLEASPGDEEVDGLLIEVELRSENFEAGIARAKRLLAEDPRRGDVWLRLGELNARSADRRTADCLASLERVLVSGDEDRALALLHAGAALDPTDPRRVAVGHELWNLFAAEDDQLRQAALAAMDGASRDVREARAAFAETLVQTAEPLATSGLMELLERSDKPDEILELGIAALRFADLRSDPATMEVLLRTLRTMGLDEFAAELASFWLSIDQPAPLSAYTECCRVLYEQENWYRLELAACKVIEQADMIPALPGFFFVGVARTNTDRLAFGRQNLMQYLEVNVPEPVPGARGRAWLAVGRAFAAEGASEPERGALEAAVAADPKLDGEVWLRLAELQIASPHGGYRTPEERWAKAMSLLPERSAELFPRWKEIGDLELGTTAFDAEAERLSMERARTWSPRQGLSPYEMYRMADLCRKIGDTERGLAIAKRLCETVPGFQPALDLAIELALDLGYEPQAAELCMERMALTGRDAFVAEILAELPPELFGAEDRLAMMRWDPEHTGRIAIARSFLARAMPERAYAVLDDRHVQGDTEEKAPDDPELERLRIATLIDLGRSAEAAQRIAEAEIDAGADPEALALCAAAYAGTDDTAALEALGERLDQVREADPRWLAAADRLLGAGEVDLALKILRRLELAADADTRGVLLDLGLAHLMKGEPARAVEAALRAEAFAADGKAELVRLLASLTAGDYAELRSACRYVRDAGYAATPLQDTALLVLEDDLPAARARLARTRVSAGTEPTWALLACAVQALAGEPVAIAPYFGDGADAETERFLLGTKERPADPRLAVGFLLALDDPLLRVWPKVALPKLAPDRGELWPALLSTLARKERSERAEVRATLEGLTASHPTSGPAWDALDALLFESARGKDSPERVDLRMRRRQALGERGASDAEIELDLAREAERDGFPRRALTHAKKATETSPDSPAVLAKLAALCAELGLHDLAIKNYQQALSVLPPASDIPLVEECLDAIAEGEREGKLAFEDASSRLEALARFLPDDPSIPLARARLELETDSKNPTLGVAHAYAHLERFRQAHAGVSLDSLRAGSTAAWGRFHLALDPAKALDFTNEELEQDPASLDLWLLEGEVLQAMGDRKGALEHLRIVQRMAPRDPRILRKLVEIEATSGESREAVNKRVATIREVEGALETDPELSFWRAVALIGSGSRGVAGSLDRLQKVWEARAELPSHLPLERVGLLYASVLISRSGEEERKHAREVLDEVTAVPGLAACRKDLARALYGLTLHEPVQ